MGLIQAIRDSAKGTMADQWLEFYYCTALDNNVLVTKGQKQKSGRSANTKGNDNIISNGSGIAVADGQCMIIVEQGKVVELCAQPGEYTYDSSTEPSFFYGSLKEGVLGMIETFAGRVAHGADTAKDQRIYYINTKELIGNKFGIPNPVPFRVVDTKIGLDIDVAIRCSGVYSYKIVDPIRFYVNVCGNVEDTYTRDKLEGQLKTEFISALQPAFGRLSELELRPNQIVTHNTELEEALNNVLSSKWQELRGLKIVSVAIGSITLPDEDAELIKNAQRAAIMRDPNMAAATLVDAQASAMKSAASNESGAMTGFMGMGMAQQAGGSSAQNLFAMGSKTQNNQETEIKEAAVNNSNSTNNADGSDSWTCQCGAVSTGKFCPECGSPRPEKTEWTCSCGHVNKGKFCENCGTKKPEKKPVYKCNKCGWEPEDPMNPPKFCPECGDIFDENDIK